MERLLRVTRREARDDGAIVFQFMRLFPAEVGPCSHTAEEGDPSYYLLMHDGVVFDGRDDERWGFRFHRAIHQEGMWHARLHLT